MSFDDNDIPEGIDIPDNSWEPEFEVEEEKKFDAELEKKNLEETSFKEFEKPKPVKAEEKVEEPKPVKKDPFEEAKQKLRDEQETIQEVPDKPYVDIVIPTGQKVGDKCVIKFSKPVPKAQVAVSQHIEWKKRDKWDRESEPELISRAFILDEHKAKGDKLLKEVSFMWEDIGIVAQQKINLLKPAEYLVEVRAWNNEAWEETNAKRLVKIE